MFELFWEREVFLHALVSLLKKGGQFTPESCNIIECIKKVDNKWGNRFFTLELLLSKIKPPRAAKFMCHPGDYEFGFNIRRENHRWVDAGVESVGLIFALTSLRLLLFLFG